MRAQVPDYCVLSLDDEGDDEEVVSASSHPAWFYSTIDLIERFKSHCLAIPACCSGRGRKSMPDDVLLASLTAFLSTAHTSASVKHCTLEAIRRCSLKTDNWLCVRISHFAHRDLCPWGFALYTHAASCSTVLSPSTHRSKPPCLAPPSSFFPLSFEAHNGLHGMIRASARLTFLEIGLPLHLRPASAAEMYA
eukprot:2184653-Pleurochrysis_carterae.AAC.2